MAPIRKWQPFKRWALMYNTETWVTVLVLFSSVWSLRLWPLPWKRLG